MERSPYLDNAVTTFKPQVVIDSLNHYNAKETANIHRGVYYLSEMATEKFEKARLSAQKFLNAKSEKEIIFTRGTTEGLNLVAQSYGRTFLKSGDEIVITHLEHHSNIVPWQLLGDQIGTKLKVVPINDLGEVEVDKLKQLVGPQTKIASFSYVSNALGSINPVAQMIKIVRELAPQAKIIIDAAQAVAHLLPEQLDVQKLDCDFMAFSGHKIYGPTGIGILYGKESLLEQCLPGRVVVI
jgi:cysteine desulfurase/selenocysteine lyase